MALADRPSHCTARVAGGSVFCERCRLSWDYGDDDAPMCLPPGPVTVGVDGYAQRKVEGRDGRETIKERLRRRFG
jgi:hypothetical protein